MDGFSITSASVFSSVLYTAGMFSGPHASALEQQKKTSGSTSLPWMIARARTSATISTQPSMTKIASSRILSSPYSRDCRKAWKNERSWYRYMAAEVEKSCREPQSPRGGVRKLSSAPNSATSSMSALESRPLRLWRLFGVSARHLRESRPPAVRLTRKQRFVCRRGRL